MWTFRKMTHMFHIKLSKDIPLVSGIESLRVTVINV
jgi:hypothetical protein